MNSSKSLKSNLIDITQDYMINDLLIDKKKITNLINEFKGFEYVTEFAHTPSFFHVGIYRAFLTLFEFSQLNKTGMIFCINDHLSIKAIKEIRMVPFKDEKDNFISKPPTLSIPKSQQKFSLNKLPPPSEEKILKMCERIKELCPKKKYHIKKLQEILIGCALQSNNLSSWFVNLIFKITKKSCLVLPTSKYEMLFNLKNLNIQHLTNGFLWVHCSNCGARLGRENDFNKVCQYCHKNFEKDLFPNVILRQNLINQLNIKYRICGRNKIYQKISDEAKYFTKNVPFRIHINSDTLVKINNIFINKLNIIQLFVLQNDLEKNIPDGNNESWIINIKQSN